MKLSVDFWKFTKIWYSDVQNNFMFLTRQNSQKWVKIQKSTDNHLSFDGIIQKNVDLSDIY